MSVKTILVVDDEEFIRELFASLNRRDFFEFSVKILTAENPEEAKKILSENENEISAVITDIDLNRFSGWDVINFVLGLAVPPKIMAMSGNENNFPELEKLGIPILEKPFRIGELSGKIAELFETAEAME